MAVSNSARASGLRTTALASMVALSLSACVVEQDDALSVESEYQELTSPCLGESCALPDVVEIKPIFIVPNDQPTPTRGQVRNFDAHIRWSQNRYLEMLDNRSTFLVAGPSEVVHDPEHGSVYYGNSDSTADIAALLLDRYGYNRFNNPYIYVVIVQNVSGGTHGRGFNGGINNGGGIVVIRGSDKTPNFQSTLQHELGHAFGLPHSWQCGYGNDAIYSKWNGESIMSYNTSHQTNGFMPSSTPGILIPEDIRNLALNQRAFPGLFFDPEVDVSAGHDLKDLTTALGTFDLPGSLSGDLKVSTEFGALNSSAVDNSVRNTIRESNASTGFDPKTMWFSGPVNSAGWVSMEIEFPYPVDLTGLAVHTQASGRFHAADKVQVERLVGSSFRYVTRQNVAADDRLEFSHRTARRWRIAFHSASDNVVVRGLRFFTPYGEVFGSKNPIAQITYPKVSTGGGEAYGSKVEYAVKGTILGSSALVGFDSRTMWHSEPVNSLGWTALEVEFPYPVSLNRLRLYTQHSGAAYAADKAQVSYFDPTSNSFRFLNRQEVAAQDSVTFATTKARRWKFAFHTSSSHVVVRGLRFFGPFGEVFAPSRIAL